MNESMTLPRAAERKAEKAGRTWYGKWFTAMAFVALVSYCVVGALKVNTESVKAIGSRLDTSIPEGANVYTALRAGATGQLYISYNQRPHVEQPFGPLFYVVMASIARVSHLDVDVTTRRIRTMTYGCYLASALMVFLICRKLGSPASLAAIAAVMLLAQPDFLGWNITARPDLLALLLMLGSLLLALKMDEHRWLFVVLAGLLAALAFLVKQPGAAVGLAIGLVLLWRKEFVRLALFSVAAAVPIVVMFSILVLRKEQFWEQYTSIGNAYWSLKGGFQYLGQLMAQPYYIVPVCIGVAGLLACLKMGKAWQFAAAFLVVTCLTGLAGLPQIAGSTNYLLPGLAGCCLVAPAAMQLFQREPRLQFSAVVLVPALLCAGWSGVQSADMYARSVRGVPETVSFVPLQSARVLTDMPMLSLRGKDPEFLDGFSTHSLELTGHWTSAPIVEELRRRQFDVVILGRLTPRAIFFPHPVAYREVASWRGISEFSPEVIAALNENYNVYCATTTAVVLKPIDRTPNIPADYFTAFVGRSCKRQAENYPAQLVTAEKSR
ncbi:MAG TPA: glycosyltransferase family 39 protein [Candidatus Sulfotelmatobacter sp.]|nr:glycosyltransferase family 39 protein [Candidatus Sulfotelmatobacter sp.]